MAELPRRIDAQYLKEKGDESLFHILCEKINEIIEYLNRKKEEEIARR